MILREHNGASWVTLDTNTSADSLTSIQYDLQSQFDGDQVDI